MLCFEHGIQITAIELHCKRFLEDRVAHKVLLHLMIRSTVGVNIMYERKNTNVCSRILDVQYVLRPIYK